MPPPRAAVRNKVDACERRDRQPGPTGSQLIGRHHTRNDCVTLYLAHAHPPIASATTLETASSVQLEVILLTMIALRLWDYQISFCKTSSPTQCVSLYRAPLLSVYFLALTVADRLGDIRHPVVPFFAQMG